MTYAVVDFSKKKKATEAAARPGVSDGPTYASLDEEPAAAAATASVTAGAKPTGAGKPETAGKAGGKSTRRQEEGRLRRLLMRTMGWARFFLTF